jgi:hypothetical protein
MTRARRRSVRSTPPDENAPGLTDADARVSRRPVANALARGSGPGLAASVRTYARRSRATGDTVQDVVRVLMDLVRDAIPESASRTKRSCEVAEWAIAAYFEEPGLPSEPPIEPDPRRWRTVT